MVEENNRIHLDAEEARAGAKTGAMRYVLAISLILVIAVFAALLLL